MRRTNIGAQISFGRRSEYGMRNTPKSSNVFGSLEMKRSAGGGGGGGNSIGNSGMRLTDNMRSARHTPRSLMTQRSINVSSCRNESSASVRASILRDMASR